MQAFDRRRSAAPASVRWMCALVLPALLAGCVQTKYTLVNPSGERYAPVDPEHVVILTDEAELDTLNYVRVAIIEATGSGSFTDQSKMLDAMRKKAGKIGANAILLPKINEPGAGAKVAAAIFGTDTQRKGNAVAVRILGRKTRDGSPRPKSYSSLSVGAVHGRWRLPPSQAQN